MGGITIIIYTNDNTITTSFVRSFMDIKHRGPDDTNFINLNTDNINNLSDLQKRIVNTTLTKDEIRQYKQYNFSIGYHRLCINDHSFNASQPFEDPILCKVKEYPDLNFRPKRNLVCNGEIYNYNELSKNYTDRDLTSTCDVEVILPLYIQYGLEKTLDILDGEFAFCLFENIQTFMLNAVNVFAVRDYLGMRPLYYVSNINSSLLLFISEIKALPQHVIENSSFIIKQLPPGTYWSFQNTSTNKFIEYYSLDKFKDVSTCTFVSSEPDTLMMIHSKVYNLVTKNVISRFKLSNSKVGILLSGGFDSSLITSVLVKYLVSQEYDFVENPLNIFTVGDTLGSDDIDCVYAVQFVKFLENKYNIELHHHIVNINNIEILASDLEKIIYQVETYDPETIKESVPYYFLMQYISMKTDVKVLLTGDGIDEFGSYDEFINLSDDEFQVKSVELLQNMHKFDLLRSDKISNMFGLEVRHPFLEKTFIEFMLSIHPSLRRQGYYSNTQPKVDKYMFRKSFSENVCGECMMEECNLWRTHRCLCESLTNFELRLTNYIETNLVTDEMYNSILNTLMNEIGNNVNTLPSDKTEMYFRIIYRKYYPTRDNLIEYFWNSIWTP